MQCPFCKTPDTRVVDSRLAEDGSQVRRRRECEKCKGRFTTFEKAQLALPYIMKRDGIAVPYDEDKVRKGMEMALHKRSVAPDKVDRAIENIASKLRATGEREVNSRQLGEWVMEELHELDQVAYVRFASIYRSFEDVSAFSDEIERLKRLPGAEQRKSQLPLIAPAERVRKP